MICYRVLKICQRVITLQLLETDPPPIRNSSKSDSPPETRMTHPSPFPSKNHQMEKKLLTESQGSILLSRLREIGKQILTPRRINKRITRIIKACRRRHRLRKLAKPKRMTLHSTRILLKAERAKRK